MKYSEFIKYALSQSLEIDDTNSYIGIKFPNRPWSITISKNVIKHIEVRGDVYFEYFELIEKAIELAKTPLEDREVEKLYYVKLINDKHGYLNKDKTTGDMFLSDNSATKSCETQFTEKEIKEIDERYWQFAVEVEE